MDFDLFSACVLCASSFLVSDLRPLPGGSGEISTGYSTFQRRRAGSTGDQSDVTQRFVAATVKWLPDGAVTTGTPETEVRVTAMFPNAHAESVEDATEPGRVLGTGSGRFESFSVLARYRLSPLVSAEGGAMQRRYKGTDLVNAGGPLFSFTEERQVVAERDDYTIGARLRPRGDALRGLELAARWEHTVVQGKYSTAATLTNTLGALDGAALELRLSRGAWELSLGGQSMAGSLPRSVRALPSFEGFDGQAPAFLRSVRFAASRRFRRWDVFVALVAEQSRLPFVTLSPLAAETRAFDAGSLPDSRTRDLEVELAVRLRSAGGFSPLLFFRSSSGSETVDLTLAPGQSPGRRIEVDRGGRFPFEQFLVGVAVEFGVGPRPESPPAQNR